MSIGQALAGELTHELVATRALIALLPEAKAGWKPHPKSMAAGDLALHLANLVGFPRLILSGPELDFAPPGGPPWKPPVFTGVAATLAELDGNRDASVAALTAGSDLAFAEPWSLKKGGAVIFTLPRMQAVRAMALSHLVHHRGQFSVYLRLLDVPLPSIYGPTADAPM